MTNHHVAGQMLHEEVLENNHQEQRTNLTFWHAIVHEGLFANIGKRRRDDHSVCISYLLNHQLFGNEFLTVWLVESILLLVFYFPLFVEVDPIGNDSQGQKDIHDAQNNLLRTKFRTFLEKETFRY